MKLHEAGCEDAKTAVENCYLCLFLLMTFHYANVSNILIVCVCFLMVFKAKELPTYKDNDFINDGQKIFIDEENKKIFLDKLRKDVEVNTVMPNIIIFYPFTCTLSKQV